MKTYEVKYTEGLLLLLTLDISYSPVNEALIYHIHFFVKFTYSKKKCYTDIYQFS